MMNRYRVTYSILDNDKIQACIIRATDTIKALQQLHQPCQTQGTRITIHFIKPFFSESKAQVLMRYTQNIRQLDNHRYQGFIDIVEAYWEQDAWSKLSTLLESIPFFCDDSRVKRDALALQLFARTQRTSTSVEQSQQIDVPSRVYAEFDYIAQLNNQETDK